MTIRHAKPYPSKEAAENSKKGRNGDLEAVQCIHVCGPGTWHLEAKGKSAPKERKPQKDTGPSLKTRLTVYERDGWACVCCGQTVKNKPRAMQHRDSRGMGGTSRPEANSPENLLTMLQGCHERVESRIDPEDNAKGYWLRMGESPALTPVMYFDQSGCGVSMYLSPDGSLSPDPPAEVA